MPRGLGVRGHGRGHRGGEGEVRAPLKNRPRPYEPFDPNGRQVPLFRPRVEKRYDAVAAANRLVNNAPYVVLLETNERIQRYRGSDETAMVSFDNSTVSFVISRTSVPMSSALIRGEESVPPQNRIRNRVSSSPLTIACVFFSAHTNVSATAPGFRANNTRAVSSTAVRVMTVSNAPHVRAKGVGARASGGYKIDARFTFSGKSAAETVTQPPNLSRPTRAAPISIATVPPSLNPNRWTFVEGQPPCVTSVNLSSKRSSAFCVRRNESARRCESFGFADCCRSSPVSGSRRANHSRPGTPKGRGEGPASDRHVVCGRFSFLANAANGAADRSPRP
mmetsp:Transcript_10427/g.43740  ORF Transcript_10427/g.43740 Transcript_10427/m.43740 type:complete len:335 (-) Transcript_10427:128-1132(-)